MMKNLKIEDLDSLDEIALFTSIQKKSTIKDLDDWICYRFGLDSCFSSENDTITLLIPFGLMLYSITLERENGSDDCILVVEVNLDINIPHLNNDLSNAVIRDIHYEILNKDKATRSKLQCWANYAKMLHLEIQEKLKDESLTESQRIEALSSYIENGIL